MPLLKWQVPKPDEAHAGQCGYRVPETGGSYNQKNLRGADPPGSGASRAKACVLWTWGVGLVGRSPWGRLWCEVGLRALKYEIGAQGMLSVGLGCWPEELPVTGARGPRWFPSGGDWVGSWGLHWHGCGGASLCIDRRKKASPREGRSGWVSNDPVPDGVCVGMERGRSIKTYEWISFSLACCHREHRAKDKVIMLRQVAWNTGCLRV